MSERKAALFDPTELLHAMTEAGWKSGSRVAASLSSCLEAIETIARFAITASKATTAIVGAKPWFVSDFAMRKFS